jgi:hypothetical protein
MYVSISYLLLTLIELNKIVKITFATTTARAMKQGSVPVKLVMRPHKIAVHVPPIITIIQIAHVRIFFIFGIISY